MPSISTTRPKPIAVLTIAEVTRAVEAYLRARRPMLSRRTRAHGLRMTKTGHFVWEIHDQHFDGKEVVEISYEKTG